MSHDLRTRGSEGPSHHVNCKEVFSGADYGHSEMTSRSESAAANNDDNSGASLHGALYIPVEQC